MQSLDDFKLHYLGLTDPICSIITAITDHKKLDSYPDMRNLWAALRRIIADLAVSYDLSIPALNQDIPPVNPTGETPSDRAEYIGKVLLGNTGYLRCFTRAAENSLRYDTDLNKKGTSLALLMEYTQYVFLYCEKLKENYDEEFALPPAGMSSVSEPAYVKRIEDALKQIIDLIKSTHNA